MTYTQKQIDRFWSNVSVGKSNECWLWKRSRHTSGYGQVSLRIDGKDHILKAHKVAYEITNKRRIPSGVHALHTCEVASCCNPQHVVLQGDLLPHTLKARGADNGRAKLTARQAVIIKYRLPDLTTREVADIVGVNYNTIWDIQHGKTWRHI